MIAPARGWQESRTDLTHSRSSLGPRRWVPSVHFRLAWRSPARRFAVPFFAAQLLTTIPRSVSQQVRVKHAWLVMFLASAGNADFWGILTRTRIPHPSSRSLSQERRVLTHGASSKSSPAEALVCSFETALAGPCIPGLSPFRKCGSLGGSVRVFKG